MKSAHYLYCMQALCVRARVCACMRSHLQKVEKKKENEPASEKMNGAKGESDGES